MSIAPASAATPVFSSTGFASISTLSRGYLSTPQRPTVFTVVTLVSGGAANVTVASITIVTQPPAGDGTATVSHTGTTHAYVSMQPSTSITGGKLHPSFALKFGICKGLASYTAGSPTCATDTIKYSTAVPHVMGYKVPVIGGATWQTQDIAVTYPKTVQKTGSENVFIAASPFSATVKQTGSILGVATVKYETAYKEIISLPKTATFTTPTVSQIGGTIKTAGIAKETICTSTSHPSTACTATTVTGTGKDFKTKYPYLEIRYNTKVTGGHYVTLPTAVVHLKAVGASGHTGTATNTQFKLHVETSLAIGSSVTVSIWPSKRGVKTGSTAAWVQPNAVFRTVITTTLSTAPSVSSVSPASETSSALSTVTITGHNFVNSTLKVYIGGAPATTVTFVSATQVKAKPAADRSGPEPVAVEDKTGQGLKTTAFTYVIPAPTITKLTADSAKAATNDTTTIVLTGTHLNTNKSTKTTPLDVSIAGVGLKITKHTSATKVTLKPYHLNEPVGTYPVIAQDGAYESTTTHGFYFYAAPTVTKVTPSSGSGHNHQHSDDHRDHILHSDGRKARHDDSDHLVQDITYQDQGKGAEQDRRAGQGHRQGQGRHIAADSRLHLRGEARDQRDHTKQGAGHSRPHAQDHRLQLLNSHIGDRRRDGGHRSAPTRQARSQ